MYKHLLDNLNTAVLLFDSTLCLRYLNTAAEILLADSERQLLGISAKQLFKSSDAAFLNNLKHCRDTAEPLIDYALALNRANHSIFVNFSVTPLGSDISVSEILVELLPIDNRLRISQEEQSHAQQNTARLMVQGLAHEIKNPLGGLRGAAQLLDLELPNAELREYTRVIIAEADRLQGLVNRMLGSNELPNKKLLNIHEVLERVRWLVQTEVGENIKIHCDYDPSIPDLLGDKNQLIQAILNIVRNAVQAIPENGNVILKTRICRHATIERQRYKLALRCEIIDDGIGIMPDMINKIFYPMVTGRAEGTGLGLSISQALISQHQGLIECSSEKGRTVFAIILPLLLE
ncbi:MAG: nitrogen regulation protein NR(II) [Methylococcales bacterium]|nr:nitrogen regulation protein NR(II) [Methylococcales bacterium]